MKIRLLLLVMTIWPVNTAYAQDVIVKKDGSTILSNVLEINETNIRYKRFSNQGGPIYTINKSEIMSINYENGEKDDFSKVGKSNNDTHSRFVEKPADSKNTEMLAIYNKDYQPTKSLLKSKKKIKGYMLIFGLKSSSVISNEDLELSFVRDVTDIGSQYQHVIYHINIKNKTNKTIYIDKGNCFKIWNDKTAYCYYEPTEQTTITAGGGSGASLGLGSVAGLLGIGGPIGQIANGISIGGGKSHSVSTTYMQQRVIAIPPRSNKNLTEEKEVITKDATLYTNRLMVSQCESFNFEELQSKEIRTVDDYIDFGGSYETNFTLKEDLVQMGDIISYDETNSPYTREYIITYSEDENFETFSSIKAELYLKELIGCDKLYKKNMYGERKILSDKYIEDLNPNTIEGYYEIGKKRN